MPRTSRFAVVLASLALACLSLLPGRGARAAEQGVLLVSGDRIAAEITGGDVDAYDFDLAENGTLSLQVDAARASAVVPRLRLFQPDGTEFDLSTFKHAKAKARGSSLRRFRVPAGQTGTWQLRVTGDAGSVGPYKLAIGIAAPPPFRSLRSVVLPGGRFELPFPGDDGALAKVKVNVLKGAEPVRLAVLDPQGVEIPGSADLFRVRGARARARVPLAGGLGTYRLVVEFAPELESKVNAGASVRFPKVKRRVATLPPEPAVAEVVPGQVRQEDAALVVDLVGTGLLAETQPWLDGEGVTIRGIEILPDGAGKLTVDVAPDAPYGPRRLVLFPPALLGESVEIPDAFTVRAPDPTFADVNVPLAKQGDPEFTFEVRGTGFRPGGVITIGDATTVGSEGLVLGPTEVVSPTLARTRVTIDLHAPVGARDVTFTQPAAGGAAAVAGAGAFRVNYADPEVRTVVPAEVRQEDASLVLTLTGRNFRDGGTVSVSGAGVAVTKVERVSDDEVRATVDVAADAPYGLRDVTYTHPADGGAAASTLSASLTVRAPDPHVTAVTPPVAPQLAQDAVLTLRGRGFRSGGAISLSGTGVVLGATEFVSDTEVRVRYSVERDAPVGARDVTFTQPAAGGGASDTVARGFDVHYPTPAVASVSASVVRQEDAGLVLTLTGNHFRPGGSVTVSGAGVTVSGPTWLSDTSFRVTLDVASDAPYGLRDLTYRQPLDGGGASSTLPSAFTVRAPDPTVSATTPAVLRQLDTRTLTVTGTGFRAGGTLSVSGTGLTLGPTTIVSATTATVDVTAAVDAPVGARSLAYTQPAAGGGASSTLAAAFTVHYPDPAVASVSPGVVKQEQTGVVLTLTGSHFRTGGTVSVSGTGVTPSAPTWVSNTSFQVTLDVAADASYGARTVTYTQPSDGGSATAALAGAITVHAPDPTIASTSPAIVKQLDVLTLTVDGTGFRAGGAVSVSGSGLSLGTTTIVSATRATVQVTAAEYATIGTRDVTYTQPAAGGGASATRTAAFQVNYPDPTITAVSPAVVKQLDSLTMTVTGTNLRAGGVLTLSGTGLTVSSTTIVSSTTATVQVTADVDAPVGARSVAYTHPSDGGGASVTRSPAFSVHYPDPAVASVSQSILKQEQTGVVLTLSGSHFRTGGTVSVGGVGVTVSGPTWVSNTSFRVTLAVAADAPYGARTVTYTQPSDGGSAQASLGAAFVVHAPDPTFTAVSHAIVKQGSNALVLTLTGTGFRDNATIHLSGSGITMANAARVSATQYRVELTVDPFAPYGLRSMGYQQPALGGGALVSLANAFTVHAPDPTFTSATPNVLKQEQTGIVVRLAGTGFRSDGTVAISGTGITTTNVAWVSDAAIDVTVSVAADATYGARSVTYTQSVAGGGASVTGAAAITVRAPDPTVTSVSPAVVKQNQTGVTITVNGTGFRSGGTLAISGGGITLGATTIVSSTQATVQATVATDAAVGLRSVTYTQPAAGGGASATLGAILAVHYPDPVLTSVSPSALKQEQTGVVVTLTGNHFRTGGTLSVTGTGLTLTGATRISDTSFQVTVAVANDAAYGNRDLTYMQPGDGGNAAVTLANAFTVRAPDPTVTSVSPSVVTQGTGPTTVTVTGTGFRTGGAITIAGTGLTLGTTTFVSATSATVTVTTALTATMGPRDVTWTQPSAGGGASGTGAGLLSVHAPAPTVTAISPSSATQGDAAATFTLTGTNFRDGGSVSLGAGVTVTNATRVSDTSFTVSLAFASDAALGLRSVTYTQPAIGGGLSGTLSNAFQVNAPTPTVTAVSPAIVKQGQSGVTLTVTGTNFRTGGTLTVSGTGLTLGSTTVVSSTSATVSVTAASNAAVGQRSITFTQPAAGGSRAGTGTNLLTVNHPDPTVTAVTPTIVEQGTSGTFTLTGTNFRSGGTVTTTGTGVTLSSPTWVSDTSFTVAFTAASTATISARDVTYSQPPAGGSAAATRSSAYQVMSPGPAFTSLTPSSFGLGTTRAAVALAGNYFNAGTTVAFSGSGVTVHSATFASATRLDLVVSVAPDAAVGQRDVTITPATGGGPAHSFTNVLTVAAPDPVVTSFSHGTIAQGASSVSVTVTGQNFRSGDTLSASGTGVTFSGVTVTGTTTITASATVTGTATTGLRDLTVTHASSVGGRSATLAGAFRVTGAVPTVTSVSPGAIGVTGTGGATRDIPLSVTGTNFMTGATVAFAKSGGSGVTVVANSTTVVSDTRLDVTISLTGAATTGLWDVTVTNPGTLGNSGTTGAGKLDVKASNVLTVNRVIANSGGPYGGERVTVYGSGFADGCSVDFGTARAYATQVLDANTLVTTVPVPASVSGTAATQVDVKVTLATTVATLTNGYSYAKDDVRFVVTSTVPAQGATAVSRNLRSAVAVLSAPWDTRTAPYGFMTGADVFWFESGGAFTPGGFRGTGPGNRFVVLSRTLTGNLPVASAGLYVLDLPIALQSPAGNQLVPARLASTQNHDQYSFTVSTTATDTTAPGLGTTVPGSGATGVDPMTTVALTFNEALDPMTVTGTTVTLTRGTGTAVPFALALSDDLRTITLVPENELLANTTYTVSMTAGLADLCGNAFSATTRTFTTASATDATAPTIDAVVLEDLPATLDGSGTYVNSSGGTGNAFDVCLPRDGWEIEVRFSDAGGAGIDPSTFSARCSVAVGSAAANAELASNFQVTGTGATWRIPSTSQVAVSENVTFTFTVRDRSSNLSSSATVTVDVVDKDVASSNGSDLDPFDARRTWVLRTDLDAYSATYSSTTSPSLQQGATTTVASNNVPDLDEALRLVGLNTANMTSAASTTVNGLDTGTNAIVRRMFVERVRETLNERFGIAADGTRGAASVNVEFLLPGEQGSLASSPSYSTANSNNSTKSFSEISIGGTNGAESGAYTASGTIGTAHYDVRNRREEANINTGASGDTGIYLLGAFKLQVNSNALFQTRISNVLVAVHGGVPVGENASDDDVLAGTFVRSTSTNTTFNARYDAVMDAIEHAALYTSAILAHEIGHSVGLVPDAAPKTGLFGNAHYNNPFTEATSTAPNSPNHLDCLGNDLMAGATTFDSTTWTGSAFKRFSPMDIAYLLNRLLYDEAR